MYAQDDLVGHIIFPEELNLNSDTQNGMSGGPVYSAYYNESQVKLAGITVSAGKILVDSSQRIYFQQLLKTII